MLTSFTEADNSHLIHSILIGNFSFLLFKSLKDITSTTIMHYFTLQAIMRSYGSSSSDPEKSDKFLAYMVPSVNEVNFLYLKCRNLLHPIWISAQEYYPIIFSWLWWQLEKDIYEENEDVSYSWIREYHWDVCLYNFLFPKKREEIMFIAIFSHILLMNSADAEWWCGWSIDIPCDIWRIRSQVLGQSIYSSK